MEGLLEGLRSPSSPFGAPTLSYRLYSSPARLFAQKFFEFQSFLRQRTDEREDKDDLIRILCISDTHCLKPSQLPEADLLIHCGDLSNEGTVVEIQQQVNWLASLPYKYKVVIAGNHDSYFDPRTRREQDQGNSIDWGGDSKSTNIFYLQHSSVTLQFSEHGGRELKIYGAPQIPACGSYRDFAFQYPREQDAWSGTVPDDTDVLVTHTPPRYHLDLPIGLGCKWLLAEIWRVRPLLHVFGHVHYGAGMETVYFDKTQKAYENLCDRKAKGFMWDIISVRAWYGALKLITHGLLGFVWNSIWGGSNGSGTFLVNAALMIGSSNTLKPGSDAEVVEI